MTLIRCSSKMNKATFKKIICVFLLLCWAITIFAFSSQDATASSNTSGGIVQKAVSVFYPEFDRLPCDEQQQINNTLTLLVRKASHFTEYAILGVLAVITLIVFEKFATLACGIISSVFCMLYAISDEIHQYFVPGRACRFIDVCIDTLGAVSAITLLLLIKHNKNRKSGETNAKKEVN